MDQQVQVAVVVEVAPFHAAAVHVGQIEVQLHEPAASIISIESSLVQSLPGQSEVQITVIVKITPGHAPVPHAPEWSRQQTKPLVTQRQGETRTRIRSIRIRDREGDGDLALVNGRAGPYSSAPIGATASKDNIRRGN